MTTKIQKWGNSLGVRLPQEITKRLQLKAGSLVAIEVDKVGIQIKPTQKRPMKLSELIKAISSQNRHTKTDWGKQSGNEIW